MYDNYNYPLGADGPDAPWNQSDGEQSPVSVDVCISQTLHRDTTIEVDDYTAEGWEDAEPDGEGGYMRSGGIDYDFSDCNFDAQYEDQEYDIPKLLEKLKELATERMNQEGTDAKTKRELAGIIKGCDGWVLDESVVMKND